MDPNGDITDAFDDDLKGAIEKGREGPWHEEKTPFVDPRLGSLERQLGGVEQRSYQQRRLAELQARAAGEQPARRARGQRPAAEPTTTTTKPPWGEDAVWREGPEPEPAAGASGPFDWGPDPRGHRDPTSEPVAGRAAGEGAADDRARTTRTVRAADPLLLYAPSMFAATLVFVAATTVHGLLAGFELHLLTRTVAAIAVTGFLWQRFQAGRLRAIATGCTCYALAYATRSGLSEPRTVFALVLGLLITMAGAGLIGVQRSELEAGRP